MSTTNYTLEPPDNMDILSPNITTLAPNTTTKEPDVPQQFYWMLIALVAAIAWSIYLTYYNSRLIGLVLTIVLNKFFHFGHVKFGSFTFSVLSGKIMFRDIHMVTEDYSLHICFGWIILRWWKPYVARDLKEDMSHENTRMSVFLDGVEFHVYNRHEKYEELARLFNVQLSEDDLLKKPPDKEPVVPKKGFAWHDLIPVIKLDINTGRLVFGNHLVPSTLIVSCEEAHIVYTTKPASTPFDLYMHTVKSHVENLRILLVPSPKYTGPIDEPPRFMGEGFVVLQSNQSDIYYYMDEPGVVPHGPENVKLVDGEIIYIDTWPVCGVNITCGKGTDIVYGPWADRQREYLWKMFYPSDYQPLEPNPTPEPGQTRQHQKFEIKMNIITQATCDILFTKNKETQAIHLNFGQGSYVESTIPWVNEDDGYTSRTNGQLMLLNTTTSLMYSSFIDCETLEFAVASKFPSIWNSHQDWTLDITACKASLWLIYQHVTYFSDMTTDWGSKSPPDLYSFVPYTWQINLIIKQFELITLANEFNWIDTFSSQQQNSHLAFCGEIFELSFQLPFVDFLPKVIPLHIIMRAETIDCCMYLPECNTSRYIIKTLANNAKITDREGNIDTQPFGYAKEGKWRNVTQSEDWHNAITTTLLTIDIHYTFHPLHIQFHRPRDVTADHLMTIEEEEEDVLRHLRPTMVDQTDTPEFDPTSLDPDLVRVELEVGPCSIRLFGTLVRMLLNVKENYFGEDLTFQDYRDVQERFEPNKVNPGAFTNLATPDEVHNPVDLRMYRPSSIKVSVTLSDIHAHLLRNCSLEDPPCPSVYVDRLGFEMDKTFVETKLQVVLSPAVVVATDNAKRPLDQRTLKYGHLGLSGLQVRGHSLFSHNGLPVDSETLEYAWLLELTAGAVTGKLTTIQLQNIVEFTMTFAMLLEDAENRVQRSNTHSLCQHMIPRHHCRMLSKYPYPCPTADDLKYRMTRASLDSMNIFICETDSAINFQVHPARLATCNLHGVHTRSGITACLDKIYLKQLISTTIHDKNDIWLECGGVSFGPLNFEAAMALPRFQDHSLQHDFLTQHDNIKRQLWFLWNFGDTKLAQTSSRCGCLGNCNFFGCKKSSKEQFFKVSQDETQNQANAVFYVNPDPALFGFGQSILHKNKLLFDVPTKIVPESVILGKRLSLINPSVNTSLKSPETPLTDVSPLDDDYDRAFSPDSIPSSNQSGEHPHHDKQHILVKQTTLDHPSSLRKKTLRRRRSFDQKHVSIRKSDTQRPVTCLLEENPQSVDSSLASFASLPSGSMDHGLQRRSLYLSAQSATFGSVSSSASFRTARTSFSQSNSRRSIASSKSGQYFSCNSSPSLDRVHSFTSIDSEYFSAEGSDDDDSDFRMDISPSGTLTDLRVTTPLFSDMESSVTPQPPEDEMPLLGTMLDEVDGPPDTPTPSSDDKNYDEETHDPNKLNVHDSDIRRDSASSTSYISEESADVEFGEAYNDVDLHDQMNQPISKSPVLMSCYASHLTQMQGFNWACLPPVPYLDAKFENITEASTHGQTHIPHFILHKVGFSVNSMSRKESHVSSPDSDYQGAKTDEPIDDKLLNSKDNLSKTMAVVKFKDSLNVLVTPLLLESVQRFVEVVTPLLSVLHPSSIMDYLHGRCLEKLQLQNKLVKEESRMSETRQSVELLDTEKVEKDYERKSYSLKALVNIPSININILQSSIIEEVITFSALDRIHEAACVSLLGVCINDVNVQMMYNTHRTKAPSDEAQTLATKLSGMSSVLTTSSITPKSKKSASQDKSVGAEVDVEKQSEITRQESVGMLHIGHIHCQLRRLAKGSNFSERIILTAIPHNKSKVMFRYDYEKAIIPDSAPGRGKFRRQSSRDVPTSDIDDGFGYIMFECGIEDVTLTAMRRLGYQNSTNTPIQEKMLEIERTIKELRDNNETTYEIEDELRRYKRGISGATKVQNPMYKMSSDSLISDSSQESQAEFTLPKGKNPLVGDASSANLEFNTVWFEFASPPLLAKKRKADFTRVDWNLLSTVTPAINAWLNPSHRLMVAVNQIVQTVGHRTSSIMACVMTEALEIQGIHLPFKTKFNKLTPLAEMLQEDPSCQMFTVLRKYVSKYGTASIELAVKAETIPQLITIQKGILALTRQWKNVLYVPQLAASMTSFKGNKPPPYSVRMKVPTISEDQDEDDIDIIAENVDDRTLLLRDEKGTERVKYSSRNSLIRPDSAKATSTVLGDRNSVASEPNPELSTMTASTAKYRKSKTLPNKMDTLFPGDSNQNRFDTDQSETPGLSHTHLKRLDSSISVTSATSKSTTPPASPIKHASSATLKKYSDERTDLYRWMANYQEDAHIPTYDQQPTQESILSSFMNAWNQEDSHLDINQDQAMMFTSIQQLANAQILFKPFLQSIGLHIESVRSSAIMKKFGGNLSLRGKLNTLKVEIIDADGTLKGYGKGKGVAASPKLQHKAGVPALLCKSFSVNVEIKDLLDFEAGDSNEKSKLPHNIKFAMHKLEAKPATTVLNGIVDVESVALFVDMSLLRLVNQFHMMIGNVSDTRAELKYDIDGEWIKTHRKQGSKDSSSSTSTGASHNTDNLTSAGTPDSKSTSTTLPTKFKYSPKPPPRLSKQRSDDTKVSDSKFSDSKFSFSIRKSKDEKSPPPHSLLIKDATNNAEVTDTSSPTVAEKTIIDEISDTTPQCWRTLYHLLDLYSTMPETKTVSRHDHGRLSTIQEESDSLSRKKSNSKKVGHSPTPCPKYVDGGEQGLLESLTQNSSTKIAHTTLHKTSFKQSIYVGESVPLVVMAIAKVKVIKIQAALSGLKLHAEMNKVHATGTYKEKVKGVMKRKIIEWSSTQYIGRGLISLLEGVAPSMKTVVKINVSPSNGLFSSVVRRGKAHHSALFNLGLVDIDIPQQPIILHGMVTRGSREISTTLSEFMWQNKKPEKSTETSEVTQPSVSEEINQQDMNVRFHQGVAKTAHVFEVIHVKAILEGWSIGAALLPSLKAYHKTKPITISGMTGKKGKFTIDLPHHTLSFKSKVSGEESTIPTSAIIDLPNIHMFGDFRVDTITEERADGLVVLDGNYLNVVAEVGMLEHTLTTDVLNHLVFVQKVFVKELNEIFQKVSGTSDSPTFYNTEDNLSTKISNPQKAILFSVFVRLKGIQVTATTPSSSAVRLETERIDVEITNRVYTSSADVKPHKRTASTQKVFVNAVVDLHMVLGQLLKNPLFEEAEAEFQTMAFFKTRISIRNALQDEIIAGKEEDQEVLMISLTRPIVLAHPLAFDKAVMVWLNYRHAYEYWSEQRLALNMEVQSAMQEIDKIAMMTDFNQSLRALFIQLNVDDMGICVPLDSPDRSERERQSRPIDLEAGPALVLTIESSQVSACSFGSLVSKGKFKGFSLRFAAEFDTSWDDWKPDPRHAPIMNVVLVPDGTYEVCSRTISPQVQISSMAERHANAKWILNVRWYMKGVDVQVDTNISKCLSALGQTLTALAGEANEDADSEGDVIDGAFTEMTDTDSSEIQMSRRSFLSELPAFVNDVSMDPKVRARLLEKQMNQQARLVQDLKELGAKESTLAVETLKLEELKAVITNDFRRDVVNKLKKRGERASVIKDKLGLSSGKQKDHYRSKSYGGYSRRSTIVSDYSMDTMMDHGSVFTDSGIPGVSSGSSASSVMSQDMPISESPTDEHTMLLMPEAYSTIHRSSVQQISKINDEIGVYAALPHCYIIPDTTPKSPGSTPSSVDLSESHDLFDEDVELRRLGQLSSATLKSPTTHANASMNKTITEPIIDFEMDIKVFIDKGRCVLNPKEALIKEEEPGRSKRSKKSKRDAFKTKSAQSETKAQRTQIAKTVLIIPSVDVKVHYASKTGQDSTVAVDPHKRATKRANLYAWVSLSSLSEEMLIGPSILDFMEQVLEPIDKITNQFLRKSTMTPVPSDMNKVGDVTTDSVGGLMSSTTSFPVDVMVFMRIDPSMVRFNCLPVSRVECLLQLPSLDIVFSTNRSAIEGYHADSDTCFYQSSKQTYTDADNSMKTSQSSLESTTAMTNSGGLSVSMFTSEFSMYIFHPYGGQRKADVVPSYDNLSMTGATVLDPPTSRTKSDLRRRDSLSLKVDFVKVNISRSRKLDISRHDLSKISEKSNIVRFSTLIDIGCATFKYDMRRLSEILCFPKSWYRRTLARRLFLGDESMAFNADSDFSSESEPENPLQKATTDPCINTIPPEQSVFAKTHHRRLSSSDKFRFLVGAEKLRFNRGDRRSITSPHTPTEIDSQIKAREARRPSVPQKPVPDTKQQLYHWETIVVFALNFSKLTIDINMSNLMGVINWATDDLACNGRIAINSTGLKNMALQSGFQQSTFEAKGGVIGGILNLLEANAFVNVLEDPQSNKEPLHQVGASLRCFETRVDYMGSSVLMIRSNDMVIGLHDEWRRDPTTPDFGSVPPCNNRPATIFIHTDLSWDNFHVMISRSTTPELIKIHVKLEEFFSNQFASSRRIFAGNLRSKSVTKQKDSDSVTYELQHHRHWQEALEQVIGCQFSMLPSPLPKEGTILGGIANMSGGNISLACFHGIDFRSKTWALFVICEPNITFETEAQTVRQPDETLATHIVQNLLIILGKRSNENSNKTMATIAKMSRGHYNPPPFTTIQDWFHYTFSCVEIKDCGAFPVMPWNFPEDNIELKKTRSKLHNHTHEAEIIFLLPYMAMDLKSEHFQSEKSPDVNDEVATVKTSFVTEFKDHIIVAMDIEVLLFVHDLIQAYIKEKSRGSKQSAEKSSKPSQSKEKPPGEKAEKRLDPTAALKQDMREFVCITWQLEPTVQLLHWASKRIDAVGADYVLQRLGFNHARETIPKWMQRGFMDPLDKMLSMIAMKLIIALREPPSDLVDDT